MAISGEAYIAYLYLLEAFYDYDDEFSDMTYSRLIANIIGYIYMAF